MLRGRRLLYPLIALAFLTITVPALWADSRSFVATVNRVSDGDTIIAMTADGTKLRVRLLGIDAPEIPHGNKPGQPYGEEARDYLDHLIGGKSVRLETYGPDRYQRVLAVIWDEQINVNLLMVAMGYTEVYRGARCQVYCRELDDTEAKARWDRVGIWVQGEKYESPVAFQKRKRIQGE